MISRGVTQNPYVVRHMASSAHTFLAGTVRRSTTTNNATTTTNKHSFLLLATFYHNNAQTTKAAPTTISTIHLSNYSHEKISLQLVNNSIAAPPTNSSRIRTRVNHKTGAHGFHASAPTTTNVLQRSRRPILLLQRLRRKLLHPNRSNVDILLRRATAIRPKLHEPTK